MNASYYAIVTYTIIILLLFLGKPSFIYDQEKQKFKDFGFGDSKSIISFPIIAIILAIITYIVFFHICGSEKPQKIKKHKIQYPPMNYYPFAYYPPQMPISRIENDVNFANENAQE